MRSAGAMMQVFRQHLEMGLLGLLLMAGVGLPLSVIADRSELDGTWMQLQGELSPVSLTSDGQLMSFGGVLSKSRSKEV